VIGVLQHTFPSPSLFELFKEKYGRIKKNSTVFNLLWLLSKNKSCYNFRCKNYVMSY